MSDPRKIEVFTAGCPICKETLEFVKQSVANCGCEVIERRCSGDACCGPARDYGIRAMPTAVVDEQIMFEGRISAAQAVLMAP